MQGEPFILDADRGDDFNWKDLREAIQRGLSITVRGYALGDGPDDARFLSRFAGATFKGRVRFERCTFTTHLDWSEATFNQTLHLVECKIKEGICLMDVTVKARCSFRGSTFSDNTRYWLNWRGLKTGRGLHLIAVTAHAPIDLHQTVVGGDLHLSGIQVHAVGKRDEDVVRDGRLSEIQTHHVAGEMPGISINLNGARISGNVLLTPFSQFTKNKNTGAIDDCWTRLPFLEGTLFLKSRIGGTVGLSSVRIGRGEMGRSLCMERATVGGSVIIVRGSVLLGQADLRATVTGQVTFDKTTVGRRLDDVAVEMNAATIGDSVSFRGGTAVLGSVDLRATIGSQVAFDDALVRHHIGSPAITLAEASVGGSFILCNGSSIIGGVDLRASIGGQVRLNGVLIYAGTDTNAIDLDEARVDGPVLFKDGTHIVGVLDLRAHIGRQLSFENTVVDPGRPGKAVTLEGANIQGPVFLRDNTLIGGDLVLLHATLRGGLQAAHDYRRRTFDRPGTVEAKYPSQRRCVILGDVECTGAQSGASMLFHEVSLLGRVIGAHLSVAGNLHICGGVTGKTDALRAAQARRWLSALTSGAARLLAFQSTTGFGEYPIAIYSGPPLDYMGTPYNLTGSMGWLPWDLLSKPRSIKEAAIHLELADIRGNLLVNGQRVLGVVNAQLIHVQGDFSLGRSLIEGDLLLQDARIEGEFEGEPSKSWEAGPRVHGVVDARGAAFEIVSIVLGDDTGTNTHAAEDYLFDNATVGTLRIKGGSLEAECTRSREGNSRWSLHRLRFDEIEVDDSGGGKPRRCSIHEWKWAGIFALGTVPIVATILCGGVPDGSLAIVFIAAIYASIVALAACRYQPGPCGSWLQWDRRAALNGSTPRRPIVGLLRAARFSAALHVDVERWARAAGDDPIADEAFLMRRRRELRERRPRLDKDDRPKRDGEPSDYSWFQKGVRWALFDFPFGYGVRWQRALHAFVLLWLLNWAVFLPHTAMESTTSGRGSDSRELSIAPATHEWDPQKALFVAMRVQVPFVELFIDADWKPADRAMFGQGIEGEGIALTYENYAAIMRILNLILVPVIIAGATGLLKPREAQYTGAS